MDDLAAAVAGGESPARVRALLESELARGDAELARKRSGYDAPVIVAVAASAASVRAVAPAAPALRADVDAVNERTWLLVAALLGALVEVAGAGAPLAGTVAGHLALELDDDPADADLLPLAFEGHVRGVDRLRARAVLLPPGALDDAADLRAAIGGRPADPASMQEHEDAMLAALAGDAGVARPHDDPDPARRVARRILQRLDGMGKWGGYHTEFAHLARGFAGNDRALADAVGQAMLEAGLLAEKPSVGQRHVFLNPRRAADIHTLIERGDVPA